MIALVWLREEEQTIAIAIAQRVTLGAVTW